MTAPAAPPAGPRDGGHGDWDALAVGWALSTLDADDEARFAVHLPGCDRCAATVRESLHTVADLAYALPDEPPPPALRDRIMAAVRAEPRRPGTAVSQAGSAVLTAGPPAPAATGDAEWPLAGGVDAADTDWFAGRGTRTPRGTEDVPPRPESDAPPSAPEPGAPSSAGPELRAPGSAGPELAAPGSSGAGPGAPGSSGPELRAPGSADAGPAAPGSTGAEPAAPGSSGGGPDAPPARSPGPGTPPPSAIDHAGRPDPSGTTGITRDDLPGDAPDGALSPADRPRTTDRGRHAAPDDGDDTVVPFARPARRWTRVAAAAAALILFAALGAWNLRLRAEQDDLNDVVAQRDATIQQLTQNAPARVAALVNPTAPTEARRATVVVRGDQVEIITETLGVNTGDTTYWLWTLRCDTPQPSDLRPIQGFTLSGAQFSVRDIGSDPGFATATCFAISEEIGTARPSAPRDVVAVGQPE